MPVTDTRPELLLRSAMHSLGLRFRVAVKLPGRPDVVFTRAKIAVFVDGCFWHSCPIHGSRPNRNVARDREKDAELQALGWEVIHVWEHEDPVQAASLVRERWRARTT